MKKKCYEYRGNKYEETGEVRFPKHGDFYLMDNDEDRATVLKASCSYDDWDEKEDADYKRKILRLRKAINDDVV